MMSFLSAAITSRYPTTNNQLRNLSNPRKQATINDGRVTLQPVQGRQSFVVACTTKTYTPAASGSNSGKQRTVICYNYKGEGHMSKQCTKPKRKRDDSWLDGKRCCCKKLKYMSIIHEEEPSNFDQSAQTVHMLTGPQFLYDHTTKQALGFQNPFYLKKAQQLEPKLYDGNVIKNTSAIVIPDSKETLIFAEESRLKVLLKQQDPMVLEKKVNTTPVDYANSMNSLDPSPFCRPTKVEVPKELPKVSMVYTSLKKIKHHLAGFNMVIKERTTATAVTKGSWGVFHQMEQAMKQHRLDSKTFKVKMNQVLNENKRLLEQVINKDIVNIFMISSVNNDSVNVHECKKCLKLKTELLNKKDFVEKETYDKLLKSYSTLEKHCISLEVDTQLNHEIFQKDNSISNQSAPNFDQYFELNELKAQSQEKDMIIRKLKERIKSLSGNMNEDKGQEGHKES
ncbi:hypothetical protein Tco_0496342 [Tanacetum coccineum]